MNDQQLIALLRNVGFQGESLRTAWAIIKRESGGRPEAFNGNTGTGDESYGLSQINMLGDLGPARDAAFRKYVKGYTGKESLLDPEVNARALYYMSNKGTNWQPWDIDSSGYDGGSHRAAFLAHYNKFPGDAGEQYKSATKPTDQGNMDVASYQNPSGKEGDLNGDGKVNKKDKTLAKDQISMQLLGKDYEFAARIVGADPELKVIFKQAVKEGWSKENFEAALQGTKWYSNQGSEYARKAWFAKQAGGPDWTDQLKLAKDTVQRNASSMGVMLSSQELDQWAERYIFEGWYDSSRQGLMSDALASRVDAQKGSAAQLTMSLTQLAQANGVKMTDQFFTDAARSIARGESTQGDWEKYIRDQAAAKFPMYAEKIQAGVSARDLASPYITRMSEILEINPNDINLDDPYIKNALSGLDEQGNPKALNYDEFETNLRKDPRWQNTTNGKKATMGLVEQMMRDWGFTK